MSEVSSPVPMPGGSAPPVSRAIYGMPMFATLLVGDLGRTTSWYTDGLGFITLFAIPGADGPVLVHLRRWQFQDLLARPAQQPVAPGNGLTLSFAAAHDELDALAARARSHGGGRVDGPEDTPWNTRDLTTVDPDGNVVIFTAARPPDRQDAAFSEQMRRWNAEQRLDTGSP
jgi:catechol 2,3-dioxygenase-like lactoylglutathione lyase family enzyme